MPALARRDPGGDAGGGEVAGVGRDRLQRLVLRPALEPGAAEADGDVGAARLQLGRLAQRELVACSSSSSALRGQQGVEEGLDLGRRHGADELVDDRPSRKALTAGIPWTP